MNSSVETFQAAFPEDNELQVAAGRLRGRPDLNVKEANYSIMLGSEEVGLDWLL